MVEQTCQPHASFTTVLFAIILRQVLPNFTVLFLRQRPPNVRFFLESCAWSKGHDVGSSCSHSFQPQSPVPPERHLIDHGSRKLRPKFRGAASKVRTNGVFRGHVESKYSSLSVCVAGIARPKRGSECCEGASY